MDIFATRRARLRKLIDEISAGNISVFAGRYDYSRSQISQYLSETYNDGRSIGERVARAIEQKVGASIGWLDQPLTERETLIGPTLEREGSDVDFPMVLAPEDSPLLLRNLPVLGTLTPFNLGEVRIRPAQNDLGERYLEFHSRDPKAYALLVKGNSMRPRVKSGEFLIIEPSTDPLPGDDVLLKLEDGTQMVVQLLYARDREYTVRDVNEAHPTAWFADYDLVSIQTITAIKRSETMKIKNV